MQRGFNLPLVKFLKSRFDLISLGLLAVLGDVHTERLLVLGGAQRLARAAGGGGVGFGGEISGGPAGVPVCLYHPALAGRERHSRGTQTPRFHFAEDHGPFAGTV